MSQLAFDLPLRKAHQLFASGSRWTSTTPTRLKLALTGSWALAAVLCVVVLFGWAQHWHAVQTVGVDAAPSVAAAHKIKIYTETLDADLVNELLGKPGEMADYVKDFDKNRVEIGKQIIAASKNITYGDAEQVPIQQIQDSVGRYLMVTQAAREAHVPGEQASILSEYRKGYKMFKEEIVPAANDLNAANNSVLQATYEAQKRASQQTLILTLVAGSTLVLLLIMTQVYVTRHFRRMLNPALALATGVAVAFVCSTATAFVSHAHNLR